jgi:hypothetical protein
MKQVQKTKTDRQAGFSFLTVMALAVLISIVGTSLYSLARYQTYSTQRTILSLKARSIAEAGANDVYNTIRTNFSPYLGETVEADFDAGRYEVEIQEIENRTNVARIVSHGFAGPIEAIVSLNVKNNAIVTTSTNGTSLNEFFAKYSSFSGGAATQTGSSAVTIQGGTIYANGLTVKKKLTATGSAVEYAGSISGAANILGETSISPVAPKIFPKAELLALLNNVYFQEATDHGNVYTVAQFNALASPKTPKNGGAIIWVAGSVGVFDGTVNACLVSTGYIKVHGTITPPSDSNGNPYPALICRDAGIDINSGSSTLNGAVIAMNGDCKFNGGAIIKGALLTSSVLDLSGNSTVNVQSTFTPPPGTQTSTSADNVIITAWE